MDGRSCSRARWPSGASSGKILMALVESMATLPGGRRRRQSDIAAIAAAAEQAAPEAASRLIERVRARTLDLLLDHASASASIEKALRGGA